MNAEEARLTATSIKNTKAEKQYNEVQDVIERTAKSCNFEVHYYTALLPAVEAKLCEEGFTISSYFDQRDGTTVTISW